jgi:hypothetical protein
VDGPHVDGFLSWPAAMGSVFDRVVLSRQLAGQWNWLDRSIQAVY